MLLTVNHPDNSNLSERLLDSSLVHMLELHGKICAWQKFPGKEVSTSRFSSLLLPTEHSPLGLYRLSSASFVPPSLNHEPNSS